MHVGYDWLFSSDKNLMNRLKKLRTFETPNCLKRVFLGVGPEY